MDATKVLNLDDVVVAICVCVGGGGGMLALEGAYGCDKGAKS